VVVDANGKIVATRSGRSIKEEGIAKIRQFGPMTIFDREGNVLGKADGEQNAFKRATPAAVSGDNN